jgi:hypothetical protein
MLSFEQGSTAVEVVSTTGVLVGLVGIETLGCQSCRLLGTVIRRVGTSKSSSVSSIAPMLCS